MVVVMNFHSGVDEIRDEELDSQGQNSNEVLHVVVDSRDEDDRFPSSHVQNYDLGRLFGTHDIDQSWKDVLLTEKKVSITGLND